MAFRPRTPATVSQIAGAPIKLIAGKALPKHPARGSVVRVIVCVVLLGIGRWTLVAITVLSVAAGLIAWRATHFVIYRGGDRLTAFVSSDGSIPNAWQVMDKRPIVAGVLTAALVWTGVVAVVRRRERQRW